MLLTSIFLGLTICIQSRPTDDGADGVEIPNKSDSIQILEFSPYDPDKNEHKKTFLKKMLYNMTYAGLNIPVEVIYDSFAEKYRTENAKESETVIMQQQPLTRRAKQQSSSDSQMRNNNSNGYSSPGGTVSERPIKLANNFNLQIMGDSSSERTNDSPTIIPNILRRFVSSDHENFILNKNDFGETSSKNVQDKFITAILGKLDKLNAHKIYRNENNLNQNQATTFTTTEHSILPHSYHNEIPSSQHWVPVYSPYMLEPALPNYLPLDVQRQWSSPFVQYFPIVIRDPFQSVLNYFSDLVEYGPAADVCRLTTRPTAPVLDLDGAPHISTNRMARFLSYNDRARYLTKKIYFREELPLNYDQRFYGDERMPVGFKQNYFARKKRSSHKRDSHRKYYPDHQLKRNAVVVGQTKTNEVKGKRQATESPQKIRGTDVGPQISKLIVRRGGVAIAGAGGIATAGSGGTAIVGPGGTAFTTPASSGGVAMVGPGGKVIKVPDLTNVLYGRTNANIAATGAGHASFTTKDGEVFTTSDNTGGMALVTPEGGIIGVSDNESFEQIPKAKKMTKELQLPAGARLLTTGPIIYYNPIYPINSLT